MGFSDKQVQALRRNLNRNHIRTRQINNGRELSYIEAWHAIAEANRIFGHDGWDRETTETRCVLGREVRGTYQAIYIAKVRITVRAEGQNTVREGHGTGEGKGPFPGETHDIALKAAETDATKRALATFGKPFGLALYLGNWNGNHQGRTTNGADPKVVPDSIPEAPMAPSIQCGPELLRPYEDKGLLIEHPKRIRDRAHLKFVTTQPCLVCGRRPSDAHHLTFAQPRAMGMKVSDEFTVPLCRLHHRHIHDAGREAAFWKDLEIDAMEIAKGLWEQSLAKRISRPALEP